MNDQDAPDIEAVERVALIIGASLLVAAHIRSGGQMALYDNVNCVTPAYEFLKQELTAKIATPPGTP